MDKQGEPADAGQPRSLSRIRRNWQAFLARPAVDRGWRLLAWTLFGGWLLFVALVLALRYAILPGIGAYKSEIEAAASRAVGLQIGIGRIEARWQGLNPDLVLDRVTVADREGQPVFALQRVEAVLSWESLLRMRLKLALLAFENPVLHVRRGVNGRISIAGFDTAGESDPAALEWLLAQARIRVRDATLVWDDRQRQAPPLVLEDVYFGLENSGHRHRRGLSEVPPSALADRLDLRGELKGDLLQALQSGQFADLAARLYVQLDYADLAGWQRWVDYPVHLPHGRGALRLWGEMRDGSGRLTTDLALEELRIRLAPKLPELDLASLRGRIEARYRPGEWSLAGKRVELQTADGLRIAPSDFRLDWRDDAASGTVEGRASASFLDLGALAQLAGHMPFDPATRKLLQTYQPQGRVSELKASWTLHDENLRRYALKASFDRLGLRPQAYFPGAEGLSGQIDLSERGGELLLDSRQAQLALPAVFPVAEIPLDLLKAKASWRLRPQGEQQRLEVALDRLDFSGPDAAGSARGTYANDGAGPGVIDLAARVDRADGKAVWRYMPHAVNADARNWIRRGIVSGRGYDGRLVLKGNLQDFPFRDPAQGEFSVTAKAADVRIDYAPGWPAIDHVDAEMSFGIGMKINAQRGEILGARLSGVQVAIPDFESHDELLKIAGRAEGQTADFLRFVSQSPVADKIDRFTDGMKASGDGVLDLHLDLPLRRLAEARLRADYAFRNNQLQVVPGLPPLAQVNGHLQITESSVQARDIEGKAFGGGFKVQVRSQGARVGVQAAGTAAIQEVSRHFGWPLLDRLSGNTGWKANIDIRQRNASVVVESELLGISSPLPEPLSKNATTALPLRIERSTPDASREQYRISLGKVAQGLIVRRGEQWERGVFAVGDGELRLPERGLAVRVGGSFIDADAWRSHLGGDAVAAGSDNGLALNAVTLKAATLRLMERDYHQVDVALRPRDGGWQIGINTREAVGDLFWKGSGEGWVEGNFRRLSIQPGAEAESSGNSQNLIDSLPGMSLGVDNFLLGDKSLGRLSLRARNERGAWRLERLELQNPDGGLRGQGVWEKPRQKGGTHHTALEFDLQARDAGKLLERLGYPEGLRRGTAKLNGQLQWNGPLTAIDYASLSGQMRLDAERGQFNKLEPGVGKLLGLISLQSLPRRLTLDFRDIFSEGLAFDSVEGRFNLRRGILRTQGPLQIKAPAALIQINGETDLKNETQSLDVLVRPELSTLTTIGATLINPVAGAVSLLAGAAGQSPLNRLFSYRYQVTGTWSDPVVEKKSGSTPSPAGEADKDNPTGQEKDMQDNKEPLGNAQ